MDESERLEQFSLSARKAIIGLSEGFGADGDSSERIASALQLVRNHDSEVPGILGEVMQRGNDRAKLIAALMFQKCIEKFPRGLDDYPLIAANSNDIVENALSPASSVELRQLTCQLMGQMGVVPAAAIGRLQELQKGRNQVVAAYAATALCWLDREGIEARTQLRKIIQKENVRAVLIAAPTLALYGDESGVALSRLTEAFAKAEWFDRCGVVRLAQTLGPPASGLLPYLIEMLDDQRIPGFGRGRAAAAIGSVAKGSVSDISMLSRALHSADWQIVAGAAEGLALHGTVSERDVATLIARLGDDDLEMRRSLLIALQHFGPKAVTAASALIARFPQEPDAELCKSIISTLSSIGEGAIRPLVDEAKRVDLRTYPLVAHALKSLGEQVIEPVMQELLVDPREELRFISILILQGMGRRAAPAIPVLIDMLRETRDIDMAHSIITMFAMCGQAAESAIDSILETMISCDHSAIADIAAEAMKQIGPSAREALERAIPLSPEEARPRLQSALVRCGVSTGKRFERFEQLDCDYLLRYFVLVGLVLKQIGTAGWGKVGTLIEPHVTFSRPKGKRLGTTQNAVRETMKLVSEKLGNVSLTTHRPQAAGMLTTEGERLLDDVIAYVRGKYGYEAVPERID